MNVNGCKLKHLNFTCDIEILQETFGTCEHINIDGYHLLDISDPQKYHKSYLKNYLTFTERIKILFGSN